MVKTIRGNIQFKGNIIINMFSGKDWWWLIWFCQRSLFFLGKKLVVIPALLRQILYGLILPAFVIQMLYGQILKIVFLFWKVLKYERSFLF